MKKNPENRIDREKTWHNQSHDTDVRASTRKFYSIMEKNKVINSYNESIMENLNPESTVFLDYGCGYGDSIICLTNNIKRGVGIDISDVRIENAKIVVKK
jgi:ubiquinone/menaquinone biosynthesis C-methylase UbiE